MKTIFFGTNHFAWLVLQPLLENRDLEVVAVVTQAASEKDIKKNRYNNEVLAEISENYPDLQIFTPQKASDPEFLSEIEQLSPDLIIVASYGQILRKSLLDIPKYGCLNVHPSLLPKWRGASPVQYTILNGETDTGITFIKMTPGMDDGPILFQKEYKIEPNWTSVEALDYLGRESGSELLKLLKSVNNIEEIPSAEQDHEKATFCSLIKKEMGEISPTEENAIQVIRKFKAFQPWPGVYIKYSGNRTKIKPGSRVKFIEIQNSENSNLPFSQGDFIYFENNLYFCVKDSAILVKKLQLEGKNVISGNDFVRGYMS